MIPYKHFILAAVPALVAPVQAQEQGEALSASDFVQAQMNILKGITEMLNIKQIADAPQEVAAGINQLSGMLVQLAGCKPTATPQEIATINAEMGDETREVASALQQALQKTADNNFYNSQELIAAIQNFVAAMQSLQ